MLTSCASNFKSADVEPLERRLEPVSLEPRKLKKWQIPVNILGGYLTHMLTHESGHALICFAQGGRIEEFHPYPGVINGEFFGGWIRYEPGSLAHLSPQEHAFRNIAGPMADILLAETINYNLRNGNVPKKYQSFWATTSLMAKGGPLWYITMTVIKNPKNSFYDFLNFERNSGVSKETMLGLIATYTAINAKRIAKEFRVAIGKDFYDYKPRKGELNLVPAGDGLGLVYSINF